MNHRSLFDELDRRVVEIPKQQAGIVLRPYQRDSVDAVFREWEAGKRSTLVCLPTGCGKSVVFSEVMRRLVMEK